MNLARPLAVILALLGCCTQTADAAVPTVGLRVAFQPIKESDRTTIEFSLHVTATAGTPLVPVTSLDLQLPAGMGLGSSTLGQSNCEAENLINRGLNGCSANARIGLGSAAAVVAVASGLIREKASLDALIGPPSEDRLEVLFFVQAIEPVYGTLILPSVIQEDPAPYGDSLNTSIPLVQAWPEGPDLALETFSFSLGPKGLTYHRREHGKMLAYTPSGIRIPRTCPQGGYPFGAILTFADGTQSANTYRVPCVSRKAR